MPIHSATISALGLDRCIAASVNGRENGIQNQAEWDAAYHPCVEAYPRADVAEGSIIKLADWSASEIYADTQRDIWVYFPVDAAHIPVANVPAAPVLAKVPAKVPDRALRVVVFNDGAWYLSRNGPVRATRVLDWLHAAGQIEPTAAVFITPGKPGHRVAAPIESYDDNASQRSLEYDQLSPDYGRFVFHEVLPFIEQHCNKRFSPKPAHRTVCGISSGGIAAFTAAWHHPDQCSRVISHCGSYTDIWGGHNTPSLIRQNPRKPIRVFLQSGANDANTPFGNWALANQTMASALEWAGYDYRFEFGTGGHNLHHGGAIFADSLRWLWRAEAPVESDRTELGS